MSSDELAIRIGGQAGDGALATGDLLAKVLHRMGLSVMTWRDFPSQIRAVHTNHTVRASTRKVEARPNSLDILLAFDRDTITFHKEELKKGGILIYDSSKEEINFELSGEFKVLSIPMQKIVFERTKNGIMKNTLALGLLSKIMGFSHDDVKTLMEEQYLGKRGENVVLQNMAAFDAGTELFTDQYRDQKIEGWIFPKDGKRSKLLMSGNDAICFGAIVAGCRFYAGYPITPASEILEFMAKFLPRFNGVAIQTEDEIAAINMAIGASYAGKRAMTATSGPGQALMTEGISYAGMTEIPIVVVHSQRVAPSTGMPTKTEQSDLAHVLYAGHGDFPRIVIAPSDVEEAFYLIQEAFNLADIVQCPIFFLVDQFLSQNLWSIPELNISSIPITRGELQLTEDNPELIFKRYNFNESGISKRTIPSVVGGIHKVTGVEHDEYGHVSTDAKNRTMMVDKRQNKLEHAKSLLPKSVIYGSHDAKIVLFAFGSTKGAILEAMESLKDVGISVRFLRVCSLKPFPDDDVKNFAGGAQNIYVIEQNASGQLSCEIERVLQLRVKRILKYNGRPFRSMEIFKVIENEVKS